MSLINVSGRAGGPALTVAAPTDRAAAAVPSLRDPRPQDVVWHTAFGPALPRHDWVPAPRYLMRRDRVRQRLRGIAPGLVLDVGCGPAALLAEMARDGWSGAGLETAPQARRLAGAFNPPGGPMSVFSDPQPGWHGRFDLISAYEVLEHIEDDAAALAGWRKWLKPGGRMLLSVPAHPELWNPSDVWAGHYRRYTAAAFRSLVQKAGGTVVAFECYGYPVANLVERARARVRRREMDRGAGIAGALDSRGPGESGPDKTTGSHQSGSDRATESRAWQLYAHGPGRWAMQGAINAQRAFLSRDLGNGYLLEARFPDERLP